jgi:para-aminobenzoate synthetase component 1
VAKYIQTISGDEIPDIKEKMLSWAQNRFSIFSFLDNNHYASADNGYECMLAIAGKEHIICRSIDCFETIKNFHENHPGWLFGHINYPAVSKEDKLFPSAFFFNPEILIVLKNNTFSIETEHLDTTEMMDEILNTAISSETIQKYISGSWNESISKEEYTEKLQNILGHIQRGDCYEMNFCMEYTSAASVDNPVSLFQSINTISPNPFSAYYRINDAYAFCASPERFIHRKEDVVISQPIKGTARRNGMDHQEDASIRQALISDPKERSENIMITDLVRNDLSKIALQGTVKVRELMGVYTFPHVHHLITTIEARVKKEMHWTEIIQACFPMGSMTGAPKKRVMELTEQYEKTARGLFSGTIGYVNPKGDFDFNVVIRTLFYDDEKKRISCKVGSGITIHSQPDKEYDECEAKISAIKSLFTSNT